MCGIVGALLKDITSTAQLENVNELLFHIMYSSRERGRDGYGYTVETNKEGYTFKSIIRGDPMVTQFFTKPFREGSMIANLRAEPTTEYVKDKTPEDQQPYGLGFWNVVHNGTIANDYELRSYEVKTTIDSAAIVEQLYHKISPVTRMTKAIEGSYAILLQQRDDLRILHVICNYRPIWYIKTEFGLFFASSAEFFPRGYYPKMVTPYTRNIFTDKGIMSTSLLPDPNKRALVVCSGGLDSVVAATKMIKEGYEVELIHFEYGSRAQGPEVVAVTDVANHLGCKLHFKDMTIYQQKDSPLLRDDGGVAGGEAGAEFAHEWVPARNLVMLSLAVAYAEANDFDVIALGNNLEEAGAYPDNEPEFIHRFNSILPFAVQNGRQVRIEMPVGNLMKHEIVALGKRIGAPMHLTWSCYRNGDKHCGNCGPCYMRQTAFEINELEEVIEYV